LVITITLFTFVTLRLINSLNKKIMRQFLRVSEKRKQQIIAVAEHCKNTKVVGEYKEGCNLIKLVVEGCPTILMIK